MTAQNAEIALTVEVIALIAEYVEIVIPKKSARKTLNLISTQIRITEFTI